jgi:hypothetical protein
MEAHVHTTFFMNNGDVWLILWSICVTMSKQDYLKSFDMSKLFYKFFKTQSFIIFKTHLVDLEYSCPKTIQKIK